MILAAEGLGPAVDKSVFPGMQGGPLMHVIAAKAVCLGEALTPGFARYQRQVVANAKALSAGLVARGFQLVSGGTDNHLMLVDLRSKGLTGKVVEAALERAHITVNKNAIPFDPEKPFVTSGIRLGTPAVTSRGMNEEDMATIAGFIGRALEAPADESHLAAIRVEVERFTADFPLHRSVEELSATR
jgi:glycine hydroxymethyltransferase